MQKSQRSFLSTSLAYSAINAMSSWNFIRQPTEFCHQWLHERGQVTWYIKRGRRTYFIPRDSFPKGHTTHQNHRLHWPVATEVRWAPVVPSCVSTPWLLSLSIVDSGSSNIVFIDGNIRIFWASGNTFCAPRHAARENLMLRMAIRTLRLGLHWVSLHPITSPLSVAKVDFLGTYIENGPIIDDFLSLLVPCPTRLHQLCSCSYFVNFSHVHKLCCLHLISNFSPVVSWWTLLVRPVMVNGSAPSCSPASTTNRD